MMPATVSLDSQIAGAYLVLEDFTARDERGSFSGLDSLPFAPVRYCHARSRSGVIRGLHFRPGAGEAKLVRCLAGEIYDVVVDLRRDSPTYRNWEGLVLTGAPGNGTAGSAWLYIPAGCAHGYQALEEDTEVTYLISAAYDRKADWTVAWDDPDLGIHWPLPPGAMSDRDRHAPSLAGTEELLREY